MKEYRQKQKEIDRWKKKEIKTARNTQRRNRQRMRDLQGHNFKYNSKKKIQIYDGSLFKENLYVNIFYE